MFIKYERKSYNGKPYTYVRVVEGYRNEKGVSCQRPIKNYGILEEQEDQQAFIKMVEKDIDNMTQRITITIPKSQNTNDADFNKNYIYGHLFIKSIYDILELDEFFDRHQRDINGRMKYRIADIVRYYSLMRVITPDSKRALIGHIDRMYGDDYNFSLDDTYRSFDYIHYLFNDIQSYIHNKISKLFNVDKSLVYYDVTNYYFEIDFNDSIDNYRHRGVSKEHRIDPIIGMGLFMDSNGLPIRVGLFNGNTSESITLIEELNKVKRKENIGRVILVGDKGINSNPNINTLIEANDGYIFSQVLKGKKGRRYNEELFKDEGYHVRIDAGGEVVYKSKSYIEDYEYTNSKGYIKTVKRKVLIYQDMKDAYIAKKKIYEKVEISKKSIKNGAYSIPKGFEEYVEYTIVDKATNNEVSSAKLKKELKMSQIELNLKYAGYFCLITSEIDYTENQIREAYHQLWMIEEIFRISKTDLEFRPVFHHVKEHIKVHFLLCYISLIVLKLFQHKLKQCNVQLSIERIQAVLNRMILNKFNNGFIKLSEIGGYTIDDEDELKKDFTNICKALDIKFDYAFMNAIEFENIIKTIKII